MDDECAILKLLGSFVPFEIAVGMNGRVWVKSAKNKNTILIANAIIQSENMKYNQMQALVEKLKPQFTLSTD